jgi:protocatechuate 3,4-dioxygenase beta subunit
MRVQLFVALALLAAATPAAGQEKAAEPPKTGSVSGVVIDEKSEDRIAKASVILRRDQEGGIGQITGSDGKFTLRDIDPGTYVLAVERDGYVVARGQSQTVQVQAGQTATDVKVKLQRTGAISGRILDADGDPISNVSVVVSPMRAGKDARSQVVYASTNDRGEYRIFHIAPGEYRLSATYPPRGRLEGVRMQSAATASDAHAPGGEAYPTVYYPGLTDARQAGVVKVDPGADLPGFDLQLVRTHGVRVRGRIAVNSSPAPLFMMVSLAPAGQRDPPGQSLTVVIRDPKGEFEFQGVLPGAYRLQVQAAGLDESSRISGHRALDVGASDIEGVELSLGKPQIVSGRVVAPEGRTLPPGLIVVLQPRDAGETQGGGLAQVSAAGTFTILKVVPGEYDLAVGSTTDGEDDAYIAAIRLGDTDALAEGVRVGEGTVPAVDIVLKANGGAAEFIVKDEKGVPVSDASVLLAPDAPRERQPALFGECRTKADGACKIVGITPGEYHAYAFPAGTEIDRRDPGALKPFEKYREAMKFAEGERKQVSLKTAPIE